MPFDPTIYQEYILRTDINVHYKVFEKWYLEQAPRKALALMQANESSV